VKRGAARLRQAAGVEDALRGRQDEAAYDAAMFDLTLSFDNGPTPDVTPLCSMCWRGAASNRPSS
jgi:hypothetical protein